MKRLPRYSPNITADLAGSKRVRSTYNKEKKTYREVYANKQDLQIRPQKKNGPQNNRLPCLEKTVKGGEDRKILKPKPANLDK